MLTLILVLAPVFFIWRAYAELAFEYERSRWGFGMLGVGVYIVARFIVAFLVVFIGMRSGNIRTFGDYDTLVISANVVGMSLGCGVAATVYFIVKRQWVRYPKTKNEDLLDGKL